MNDTDERPVRERGRLRGIFDEFPPGTPVSLDDLEAAMARDTERRALAALDRALVRLATPALAILPPSAPPDRPA